MIVKIKRLICRHFLFLKVLLLFCSSFFMWNTMTMHLKHDEGTYPVTSTRSFTHAVTVKSTDAKQLVDTIRPVLTSKPTEPVKDQQVVTTKASMAVVATSFSRGTDNSTEMSTYSRISDENSSFKVKLESHISFKESDVLLAGNVRHNKSFLVVGVPTARRSKANYILGTLTGLVQALSDMEKNEVVIVVFSTDFDLAANEQVASLVKENFPEELERGLVQVIRAPRNSYATLEKLQLLWGDKPDRVKWRSKQCLDYVFLFNYCHGLGTYYLQLEDDVNTQNNFYSSIKKYIAVNTHEKWSVLDFGARGFIGILYRSSDLQRLALFIKMYYWIWPVDILFRHFNDFNLYGNSQQFVHKPLLFKHIGKFSTLEGQVRKLEDSPVQNVGFRIHKTSNNPPAVITTSITEHSGGHGVDGPYNKEKVEMFWAKNLKIGDNITILFIEPIKLARFVMETSSTTAIDDFPGGVKLRAAPVENMATKNKCGNFTMELQEYKNEAHIEYTNKNSLTLNIKCLRLVITELRRDPIGRIRWMLIREMAVWTFN